MDWKLGVVYLMKTKLETTYIFSGVQNPKTFIRRR